LLIVYRCTPYTLAAFSFLNGLATRSLREDCLPIAYGYTRTHGAASSYPGLR